MQIRLTERLSRRLLDILDCAVRYWLERFIAKAYLELYVLIVHGKINVNAFNFNFNDVLKRFENNTDRKEFVGIIGIYVEPGMVANAWGKAGPGVKPWGARDRPTRHWVNDSDTEAENAELISDIIMLVMCLGKKLWKVNFYNILFCSCENH